ncbi:Uncharacterised protein [Mycobacterium tuberculosis]|uniref:Uncharacterized protein n=1 Tax=Mycobacterium tuberculosis TaxID=1773 RepID=A0A0U0T1K9_MYCTX|nr:Uncharacterised protein [Mycobacterium tuberculosis]COW72192.1 Uncharacterised protein [Mycobacterium tuberculosis]COX16790.1 Uncharacterised protein [Mycobacterium tuberculosis]
MAAIAATDTILVNSSSTMSLDWMLARKRGRRRSTFLWRFLAGVDSLSATESSASPDVNRLPLCCRSQAALRRADYAAD